MAETEGGQRIRDRHLEKDNPHDVGVVFGDYGRTLKAMGLSIEDAVWDAAGPAGANVTLSSAQATPEAIEVTEILEAEDRPWVTVVWDDPVNLMHYVAYIFQKLFGYSKSKATELMLKVHNEGKAVVSSGSRDKMEHDVQRLHAAGLWATMQRDD